MSVLDGHDVVLYSDSVEDTVSLDCEPKMGVDEWSGSGNYNLKENNYYLNCARI